MKKQSTQLSTASGLLRGNIFKIAFFFCMLFVSAFSAYKSNAQAYIFASSSTSSNVFPFATTGANTDIQWLFQPGDFAPATPSGSVTDIYLKSALTVSGTVYSNLVVKMGQTSLTQFSSGTYSTGLTTVFSAQTYTVTVNSGSYLHIVLQSPFAYSNTSNFILEISEASYSGTGMYLDQDGTLANRRLYGGASSATAGTGLVHFGMDIATTPCAGKPTAGTIVPVTPCPNTAFGLSLQGNSQAFLGLTFLWQDSIPGSGVWANVIGGTSSGLSQTLSAPNYYRCILNCTNSNLQDTTPRYLVTLAPFYQCYCTNTATYTGLGDLGNVTIKRQPSGAVILNNGSSSPLLSNTSTNATALYINYAFGPLAVSPPMLYPDSTYSIALTEVMNGSYFYQNYGMAYIDYNHNQLWDASEQLINTLTTSATQAVQTNFIVPHTAMYGLTGLRALMCYYGYTPSPCGTYYYGGTQDYLVYINLPPCSGPTNAGTALTTDTAVCVGYPFSINDATHEKLRSFISWSWQSSTNGGASYLDIPNSTGVDSINNLTISGNTKYRLRMICQSTNDTTYSNVLNIKIGQPWQCYCYSIATGGSMDTSDIGSVTLGKFTSAVTGPHLGNPAAIRARTDYTNLQGPILYADSTYRLSIYEIMKNMNHADARVSVFLDFNNNFQYDLQGNNGYSPEMVYTGITTAADWYLDTYITIPDKVIPDVPTGMRVILNNDVSNVSQANLGCGAYVSGETEDYVVTFKRPRTTGVVSTGTNLQDVSLYPNPTGGRFTLSLNAVKSIKQLDVIVTSITGQQIMTQSYSDAGTSFTTSFDLSKQARGIYFVELRADGDKMIRKLVVE